MPLPDPLLPAEVDLRDFSWMPIEIHRLRRSKAWLMCKRKPELAFYMLNLWTACWHDTPAGSLEDDDDVLADLAMCEPTKWAKVRDQVLHGWIKASDGRLYHPVVAEKAQEAWAQKQAQRQRTEAARLAREQKRQQSQQQPMSSATTSTVTSSVTETVTASNGTDREQTGQGTDRERRGNGDSSNSAAVASAASAAPPGSADPPPDPAEAIFALGLPLLTQAGVAEKNARSFLGFLRKQAKGRGGDPAVVQALQRCADAKALQPVEFLQGCFKPAAPADDAARRAETTAEAKRLLGFDTQEAIDG